MAIPIVTPIIVASTVLLVFKVFVFSSKNALKLFNQNKNEDMLFSENLKKVL